MNWEAISAIGEIVGALAVVVSLIYLAAQIRQNTRQIANNIKAAELSAFERNLESGNRTREFFLLNPKLFELYKKGWKSYSNLDKPDKAMFSLITRNVLSQLHGAYIRQLSVSHDPQGLIGLEKVVDGIVLGRGIQEYLRVADTDWRPEFREFVNSRLELAIKESS